MAALQPHLDPSSFAPSRPRQQLLAAAWQELGRPPRPAVELPTAAGQTPQQQPHRQLPAAGLRKLPAGQPPALQPVCVPPLRPAASSFLHGASFAPPFSFSPPPFFAAPPLLPRQLEGQAVPPVRHLPLRAASRPPPPRGGASPPRASSSRLAVFCPPPSWLPLLPLHHHLLQVCQPQVPPHAFSFRALGLPQSRQQGPGSLPQPTCRLHMLWLQHEASAATCWSCRPPSQPLFCWPTRRSFLPTRN
mmetsp:Transcript_37785/g.70853  ORF Transcript_37785/g.70853 Transcript_37785/m.70853 type:complete len:247 (-) Transcript_37785:375-1115(-)